MISTKRIVRDTSTETLTVDNETGEVLKAVTKTSNVSIVEREPDYVKLYIKDLSDLANVPKFATPVLYEFVKRIGYDNQLILNAGIKRQIQDSLKKSNNPTSMGSINNAITCFIQNNIFIRKDTGIYLANANYFGRGAWKDIQSIKLTIDYNSSGERTINAKINKGDK